ncbi:hypothetical protein EW026_g3066 [Hermanssonia centrifuga]|uniref:F-BAR domain-containing protein n=1 Tax=Hermanssonia centrifuga TaxID=98765 RepID=A0A4S4KL96_9APHY|nr:hypothetical protein EW026_g3066 [Hermanssonia centrifuga]
MSTRRQPSSTSLSKYARAHSPDYADRSYDFCNAFWGLGDAGVDVLFTRMRGAIRTVDEIRNFWKERANIEDQYARKLAALAKVTLGRDEIGELRNCLDTLRSETAKQAEYHNVVAEQIKKDLEGSTTAFLSKQMQHKKTYQAQIEKELKVKQQQEAHVSRAREKYESDCTKINSYTAQSTLLQGRELEKVQQKLRNTQQTITANERDFAQFSRELKDTVAKWEVSWKAFCDTCQDLEEERTEFMKDYMWAYANAISTVCVSDDEACEKMRLSLELLEPERDMENFVRDYGTGNAIPEPPTYVSYSDPTAVPSSSQRPNTHLANFERRTQRSRPPVPPTEPPEEDPAAAQNTAGIGAGGGRSDPPMSRSRSASRASLRNLAQAQAAQDRSQAQPAPPIACSAYGLSGTDERYRL